MSDETGNLVVKVNVKKNVEEGPMMASAELLEALVSSSKADSVSNMANEVIWVASGLFGLV
jgi:RNA-binding protein YhbY